MIRKTVSLATAFVIIFALSPIGSDKGDLVMPNSEIVETSTFIPVKLPSKESGEYIKAVESRGDLNESEDAESEMEFEVFEVTAYTLREEECGKTPDHPEYGITVSGKYVTEWQTIAGPKSIPFGTKVYIPFFKDKPNEGWFVVEDRGDAITEGHFDVYMEDLSEALNFGRRKLEVYILAESGE